MFWAMDWQPQPSTNGKKTSNMLNPSNEWTAELPATESQEMTMAVRDQIEKDFGLMGLPFPNRATPPLNPYWKNSRNASPRYKPNTTAPG
jgi:hypothetical protein